MGYLMSMTLAKPAVWPDMQDFVQDFVLFFMALVQNRHLYWVVNGQSEEQINRLERLYWLNQK